jgi:hypothetical protein
MNIKKTLILAVLAAMSVEVGSAMARESADGVGAGPDETRELVKLNQVLMAKAAVTLHERQFGSSGYKNATNSPILQGSDGNGR